MGESYKLRPLKVPEDYEGLATLLNTFFSEPITAERLREDDTRLFEVGHTYMDDNGLLAGYDRTRYVAVADEDRIVGYVWSWRAPWTEPGYLNNTVVVQKEYRGQGIGGRLVRHLVQWGEGLGAAKLVAEIWDDDPAARRFAENRGFAVDRHAFQSVLELETAKPEILNETGLFERLEAEGIRIRTFAEEGETEENEARIYQVYLETLTDIPGFMGEVPDRGEWSKWHLRVEGYAPERVLLAVDGKDGRYVAVSNIPYKEATGGMYHEYTGVCREYRGRKIAQALKIRAVQLAKRQGAVYLKTDNDSLNAAILKVNQSLGYVPQRGSYRIAGDLQAVKEEIANRKK
ncbi:GNAT family N-acetyltransferase [Cohnella ginsengisoli]|uniref:GNAT family N-acetyltransferase n=1 Tax=Cohnella ginsengisoli TaxID=425004 RepID=A0A9X4QRN9_9BACL|nr:GNAT family N-acetyltransferase [Cohnella ginsengisoli]MDG0795050.1 GNAT family N-acetyltransferase [Cohnella ginsengisoli]